MSRGRVLDLSVRFPGPENRGNEMTPGRISPSCVQVGRSRQWKEALDAGLPLPCAPRSAPAASGLGEGQQARVRARLLWSTPFGCHGTSLAFSGPRIWLPSALGAPGEGQGKGPGLVAYCRMWVVSPAPIAELLMSKAFVRVGPPSLARGPGFRSALPARLVIPPIADR